MKLREKLAKLILYKFRYNITMPTNEFLKLQIKGYNIKNIEDNVNFDLFKINKDIRNSNYSLIIDRYKDLFNFIFKKKVITFLSIIIIFTLFLISNYTIREIKFKDELEYNYSIYQDVRKHIKKIGPFEIFTSSLNEVSNELKQKYYYYAYVGLEKKGAKIIIDIEYIEHEEPSEEIDENYSDLVSNVDGKVVGIEAKSGLVLVSINQIVSKGEKLVTGNLNYFNNPSDFTNLVKSDALVFIEYAKYIEVEVPKNLLIEKYNGNYKKYYSISILGKEFIKNKSFEKSYLRKTNIFKLDKILRIDEIYEYEKIDYLIYFDIDEAKEYSLNKIYSEFESKKVSSIEKIEFIKTIKEDDDGKRYRFSYIIKCIEDNTIEVKNKKED